MTDSKFTIMVVEDERLLLEAIGKKFGREGIDSVLCEGGEYALESLRTLKSMPTAIWLDYYLKDMDGLTFMSKLKENPKWESIPVVVVSNSASPEKVNGMLALGAKRYLLKAEYRLDEIIKTIHDFISGREKGVAPISARKKILIIEDDQQLARAYRIKLSRSFDVFNAMTGEEGLKRALEWQPSFIILDLLLPGEKNGLSVLSELKQNTTTKKIPVIVLTNLEGQCDAALKGGAAECYIKTSITMEDVVAKVEKYSS